MIVVPGFSNGNLAFILYREPKLAVFMVLGWALLAAFCWSHRKHLDVAPVLKTIRRPEVCILLVLIAYMALTLSWMLVPENGLYEISQYGLLAAVLMCLVMWSRTDQRVVTVVRWSLVVSIAGATVIGLLQMVGWLSFLPPIDPYNEVGHSSLMGYKNPMALAVMGQLFVLVGGMHSRWSTAARGEKVLLSTVLIGEVFYIVSLLSRSSMVGLLLGAAFLALLQLYVRKSRRPTVINAAAIPIVIVSIVFATVMINVSARDKAASVLGYLAKPATILESDRGVFALNTINMVRSHPFGVGIGDWQSNYPLYRAHGRYFNFNSERQLRRAHSDHVQILGEVGWPGLALWLAFLATLIWRTALDGVRRKSFASLCLAAQLVAISCAMCTDYVIEFPYLKLQFFLVVFLSVVSVPFRSIPSPRIALTRRSATMLAVSTTIFAAISATYYLDFTRKQIVGGHLSWDYLSASSAAAETDPALERFALNKLEHCALLGDRFDQLRGHTKTTYRDHLLIGDAWRRLHRPDAAREHLVHSLELNPYHAPAFRVMSLNASSRFEAQEWSDAADAVMDRAEHGFPGSLPVGHPLGEARGDPATSPPVHEVTGNRSVRVTAIIHESAVAAPTTVSSSSAYPRDIESAEPVGRKRR